jgi:small-conductance mechanosensitive channel
MHIDVLTTVAQLSALDESIQRWVLRVGAFVGTFLLVYLVGRLLVLPPVKRAVQLRNTNNPTVVDAIDLYLRIAFVVVAFPIAIGAAGFGKYLSGSAIVVAALTLAVGVAGQDVISNLVSGVFLVLDANFNVGDHIQWNDRSGTVVKIGLRSTRVRTPKNEIVTVPNNDLSTNPVTHPFDGVRYRVNESIVVAYDEDIPQVAELLREVAAGDERILTRPEPAIHVDRLGGTGVELVVRYWVVDPGETDIGDTRTAFASRAKDRLAAAGVTVAPANLQELTGGVQVEDVSDVTA